MIDEFVGGAVESIWHNQFIQRRSAELRLRTSPPPGTSKAISIQTRPGFLGRLLACELSSMRPWRETGFLYTLFWVFHKNRPGVEGQNGGSKVST